MSSIEHPEKPKPYTVEKVVYLGSAGVFGKEPGIPLAKTQETPLVAYQSTETKAYYLVVGRVENFLEEGIEKLSNWTATMDGLHDFTIHYKGTFKDSVAASDFLFQVSVTKEYWLKPKDSSIVGVDLNRTKGDGDGDAPTRKTKIIVPDPF